MIFMTMRALCVSNHTLTIETGRYHQQWLPKESRICPYCTHGEERERARARERVCVCVCVCVPLCVGGPRLIHLIYYFLPMSLRIWLEARNGIPIKMILDPWLYPAISLEQRETLHQIILLCVPLNHHSFSPSLTFLGSGPLFSSSSRAACAAACLARLRLQPTRSGNSSPPQLDPSCEANRER